MGNIDFLGQYSFFSLLLSRFNSAGSIGLTNQSTAWHGNKTNNSVLFLLTSPRLISGSHCQLLCFPVTLDAAAHITRQYRQNSAWYSQRLINSFNRRCWRYWLWLNKEGVVLTPNFGRYARLCTLFRKHIKVKFWNVWQHFTSIHLFKITR